MAAGAALLLALLAAPCRAAAAKLPPPPKPSGGWQAAASSLLLFDADGKLVNEIGLGAWTEELGRGRLERRSMSGGVSRDGRFAWHWQRIETIASGRTEELVESTRAFVYLGSAGQILWRDGAVDAPPKLAAARQSADGQTVLLLRRADDGYSAAAVDFTGKQLCEIHLGPRVVSLGLTENGRFAHALWGLHGQPLLHSFLDLKTRERRDIPAADAELGRAEIGEDGLVRSGGKLLHAFP